MKKKIQFGLNDLNVIRPSISNLPAASMAAVSQSKTDRQQPISSNILSAQNLPQIKDYFNKPILQKESIPYSSRVTHSLRRQLYNGSDFDYKTSPSKVKN